MKKILLTFALLAGAVVGSRADEVPGVTVQYVQAGTPDYKAAISAIGRLQFVSGKASILFSNGDTHVLGDLSGIDRISFGPIVSDEEKPTANVQAQQITVSVFPNPTSSVLHVTGQPQGEVLRLIDENGRIVLSTSESDVSMGGLHSGLYFLQCGDQIVKVIKK